jgi:hypothetical protein
MNHKRTIIALAVIVMAIASMSLIMSDSSDARMTFGKAYGDGFSNTGDGTLFVPLYNEGDAPQVIEITVTYRETGKELIKQTVTVQPTTPGNPYVLELRFKIDRPGDHTLRITGTPAAAFPSTEGGANVNYIYVDVNVSESIWSKTTTYLAIAAIAILIVIAAYMRIRSSSATKPEMTFTELERQQKESRGEAEEKPRSSATEKRKYKESESSKKSSKKQQAPPPEKKEPTFTELENQKKAEASSKKGAEPPPQKKAEPAPQKKQEPAPQKKQEPPPKKDKPQEEPKKLKYVSSRRK